MPTAQRVIESLAVCLNAALIEMGENIEHFIHYRNQC